MAANSASQSGDAIVSRYKCGTKFVERNATNFDGADIIRPPQAHVICDQARRHKFFLYKGGSIDQLIRAGLWRSTAVLAYLERAKIMGILYAEDAVELAEQRDNAAPEEVLEE